MEAAACYCGRTLGPDDFGGMCSLCRSVGVLDEDDDLTEPVGSCDACGINVYASEDDFSGLCDTCLWFKWAQGMGLCNDRYSDDSR